MLFSTLGPRGSRRRVYLGDGDATQFGEVLFGLFTGVRVGQVGVEILVQALRGLLAEIASFAPGERQTGHQQQRNNCERNNVRCVCVLCCGFTHTGVTGYCK